MKNKLTHIDSKGRPAMVNISIKKTTARRATAIAILRVNSAIARQFDGRDIATKKGPVFHTAIIAGTQAVKDTSRLIPFCHPLPLDGCAFDINLAGQAITVHCTVHADYKTGVEMEALTGATVAALTMYDMCKAVSHDMEITSVRLLEKSGGKRTVSAR